MIAVGERFGRLMALHLLPRTGKGSGNCPRWYCICECGNTFVTIAGSLRNGGTRSCGCLARELKEAGGPRRTHGQSGSAEHGSWRGMLGRCRNPTDKKYPRYGGRGIQVCERWLSFENFLADMGQKPSLRHSLDRIDNDGNYEPGNCRWATDIEQANNRPVAKLLTYNGQTKPLGIWARELGIGIWALRRRLLNGWAVERALSEAVRKKAVLLVGLLFLTACSIAEGQQNFPNHGPWFRQSPDFQKSPEVQQSCVLRFDKALDRMVCVGQLAVTLSAGKQTVVSNLSVNDLSRVRCGCLLDGYEASASCNEQAAWLGRIRVTTVGKGTFTIAHSYAIGNEQVRCSLG